MYAAIQRISISGVFGGDTANAEHHSAAVRKRYEFTPRPNFSVWARFCLQYDWEVSVETADGPLLDVVVV